MTGKLLQPSSSSSSSSWKGLNFEFLSFLGLKFEMLDFIMFVLAGTCSLEG
jgi:hypothetical protein